VRHRPILRLRSPVRLGRCQVAMNTRRAHAGGLIDPERSAPGAWTR
jgi:hypothetical protein